MSAQRESLITDCLLGEATPEETSMFERFLVENPEMDHEADACIRMHEAITAAFASRGEVTLTPARLEAIQQALQSHTPALPFLPGGKPGIPKKLALVAAIAAAILISAFLLTRQPFQKPRLASEAMPPAAENPPPAASQTATSKAPSSQAPEETLPAVFDAQATAEPVLTRNQPALGLPVSHGNGSLDSIRTSIRSSQLLPVPSSVRTEELLNAFQLRPNGRTIVSRAPIGNWHPDNRSSGSTTIAASLSAELIPCPWRPSACLMFVSLRGSPHTDTRLAATFIPDAAHTPSYRLIGYDNSSISETPTSALPAIAPGKSALIAVELSTSAPYKSLGTIRWNIDGRPATALDISFDPEIQPSADARFASLICAWSAWLRGENIPLIDRGLVQGLARECDSDTLDPKRSDFLRLVEQSLLLK